MNKKVFSMLLAFAMVVSSFSFVSAETNFTDINGHWAEEDIKYLFDEGIVKGYTDDRFNPDGRVTRAEFVTMVNRSLELTKEGEVGFTDVPEARWYHKEIAKAMVIGYIEGYTDNTFRPANPITREEAATIIARGFGLEKLDETTVEFVDGDLIQNYAEGFVNAVAEAGYIEGYPDGNFRPQNNIKRSEASRILYKIMIDEEFEIPTELIRAIKAAEQSIAELPTVDEITLEYEEAVLATRALVAEALELDEDAIIDGADKLEALEDRIDELKGITANVETLAELNTALENEDIKVINILKAITEIDQPIVVNREITINGNGNSLGFTGLSNGEDGLTVLAPVTINNLTVNAGLENPETWVGTYAIQVYNTEAILNNVTASGGNGGIMVNASDVTLEGTVAVQGNGFGGIEVSRGAAEGLENSKLTVNGLLVNETEKYREPTIWLIEGQGEVVGVDEMFINEGIKEDQIQYYIVEENATE